MFNKKFRANLFRIASAQLRATVLSVCLSIVVLAVVIVVYVNLPWWLDGSRLRHMTLQEQQAVIAADRGDALKLIAGIGGLVVIAYTARRHALDRRTLQVTQDSLSATLERDFRSAELATEAQVTDRYTKAIGQLASDNPTERLGGIYALERVMHDSVKDHETIVEVLAAFIRERAVAPSRQLRRQLRSRGATVGWHKRELGDRMDRQERVAADVQAALAVLARRPTRDEKYDVDLHGAWLPGVNLPGARLVRFNFYGAYLANANLIEANLDRVYMAEACLNNARLLDASLNDASLAKASMNKANFTGAHLNRANLLGARLHSANLAGAQMGRVNLFRARLDEADMFGTHLEGANLRAASMVGARMTGVHLSGAELSEADLRHVRQLTVQRLTLAWVDASTILPAGLRFDENEEIIVDESGVTSEVQPPRGHRPN